MVFFVSLTFLFCFAADRVRAQRQQAKEEERQRHEQMLAAERRRTHEEKVRLQQKMLELEA